MTTKIEGVIFDWAGTAVDFGCFAPVNVFLSIFKNEGVEVTLDEAREPMGMLKIDHIRAMLQMPRIHTKWQEVHGKAFNEEDVNRLYEQFEHQLMISLAQYTTPIHGVIETVKWLRANNIKIGSTTGYTKEMMAVVVPEAKKKGYAPDHLVTPTDLGDFGRPYPYMIFENMRQLQLSHVKQVVKVGDTASDINEALHAGVWAVGVLIGSSEMGVSEEEFQQLTVEQQQQLIEKTRVKFESYGAHFTIETMQQLPKIIEVIEAGLQESI
ncbi:phosphonoacetaldehyde hydrolase [Solibacillus sp. FSL R7-0668]|uniref:phosphonoacetaldehyde hydrolase n=1 Tax=Solibacillus sp. FSL R7-0668 TaxID=2921688 RepID=UPI0030F9440E